MPWRANSSSAASSRRSRCCAPRAAPEGRPGRRTATSCGAAAGAAVAAFAAAPRTAPPAGPAPRVALLRTLAAPALLAPAFPLLIFLPTDEVLFIAVVFDARPDVAYINFCIN